MTGMWVVLGVLALGLLAGLALRLADGRVHAAHGSSRERAPAELPARVAAALVPEHPVTLVQISTTFCSRCPQARAQLSALAERTDGLRHAELDVTHSPDVAHQLGVRRTPTTIAYGPDGAELLRVGGVPDAERLLDALRPHLAVGRRS